jgi:small subunit ribosomal protein S7
MPRRREVPKREILPDPKFGNVELSKFMNVIMEGGKKAVAERIIYGALEQIEKKTGKDPLEALQHRHQQRQAHGGSQVPPRRWRELPGARRSAPGASPGPVHALDQEAARKRSEKSMALRLANELMEANEGRGGAMKKRDEVHRMAEANKAFSHFRF